jgi:serine-type D-Ala-D-Ala carboxypeptidase
MRETSSEGRWWPVLASMMAIGLWDTTPVRAQTFGEAERSVRAGLARQVYPGAVLVIGNRDSVLLAQGYGHLTWNPASPVPSASETFWDLASLTKVIAATSVAARLVDRGALDLDAPVARYIPEFTGSGRDRVTVRRLLDHTSGLPAWLALWREASSRETVIARIAREPLKRPPGTAAVYSDLNAILLGRVLEVAGGASLDLLFQREVAQPLGLGATSFRPAAAERSRSAPTSREPGLVVRGEVHDLNAAYLAGVSGHAGLFASGLDVARVAQAWLGEGSLHGKSWVSRETVKLFLRGSPSSGTRLLGWDSPDTAMAQPSAYGEHPGPGVYGHTGWTGTQVWLDPDNDRFVVLLTNRAYEPRVRRTFDAMREVRTSVADAVQAADRQCLLERLAAC